jgi:pimeloyl-ACP methyl ester carboxylesterase
MTFRRTIVAGTGVLAVAAGAWVGLGAAAPAGASTVPSQVVWGSCPQYSDGAVESLGIPADLFAAFRALLARTQCGTVQVPLDYANPDGGKITIAVTRLAATDQKHKLGTIAMNPGGPGGSGYLMPQTLALGSPQVASLLDRYDMVGFDPRGVGYSTKTDCPPPDGDGGPISVAPGPISEATARQFYDSQASINQACWRSNPAFLGQLTTANVARDLNQVRQAMRLSRISYFGASWGTLLGAVYRSMFSPTVARMWLDSVVGPNANRLDVRAYDTAAAQEQDAARWAAWAAARNATYGLGSTAGEVEALVKQLMAKLDANPVVFSDVPGVTLDGNFIAFLAGSPSPVWSDATQAMKEMTTARTGEPAPPTVAPIISGPPTDPTPPPADAPEQINQVATAAILCNDDTGPHDFATFWSDYRRLQEEFPMTARLGLITEPCAGWPVPTQPFHLRKAAGSLEMSGHRYESTTPYPWVGQLRSAIGGTVFTVDDDIHGSLPFVADCAEHLAAYFMTGRADSGQCQGVAAPDAAAALAATQADATPAVSTRRMPRGNRWRWRTR